MTESEALARMISPGTPRAGKWRGGVIQIMITRACDKACLHCTQGSNLAGKPAVMTPEQFEWAVLSLRGYPGVYGVFGGNPALNVHFDEICAVLREYVPHAQRGIWCNHPRGRGATMRATFNPAVSNLNCHMDREAYDEFRRDWPEARPFGVDADSRHAPVFVSMKDVGVPEGERWRLISGCDINQHWSALVGVFRGQLRAFFCEIAYAQAALHEGEGDYPDTGIPIPEPFRHPLNNEGGECVAPGLMGDASSREDYLPWWRRSMVAFREQVRTHCHSCGVPLRGYGALALDAGAAEQTSPTHAAAFRPKTRGRPVEVVTTLEQLGTGRLRRVIDYVQNARV